MKQKWLTILGVLAPIGLIALIFRGVIFSAAMFSHVDVLTNYLPYLTALSHATGFIDWHLLNGFPIFVSFQTTWFDPLNKLLFHFFDAFDTYRILDIGYLAVAYLGTYWYGRRIGLSQAAAVLTGMVYVFGGQNLLWAEATVLTAYYAILPLVLCLFDLADAKDGWLRWVYGALAGGLLGLGWLSGHAQWLIYIHLLVAAWIVFRIYAAGKICDWRHWVKQLAWLAMVFAISFAVGYPQIMTVLRFLPMTERAAGGVGLGGMFGFAYLPYHAIHYFLPFVTFPSPIPWSAALENYIGILPVLLLVFGWIHFKKIANWRSESGFYLLVGWFCLLASVKYSPIIYLFHYLPLFKHFDEAPRIMFVGDFAFGIWIGFTIDWVVRQREQGIVVLNRFMRWCRRLFVWIAVPVISLFSILTIFFFGRIERFLDHYYVAKLAAHSVGGYPIEHYFTIIHTRLVTMIGQFSITNSDVVVFIVFSLAAYWLFIQLQRRSDAVIAWLAVGMTVLNIGSVYAARFHTVAKADYVQPPTTAQVILQREHNSVPFRIFTPLDDETLFDESIRCTYPNWGNWDMSNDEFLLRRELLLPNLNMLYGIESADGYEPYRSARMGDLLAYLGGRPDSNRYGSALKAENVPPSEKVTQLTARKNLLRIMNVKYVLSHYAISDPDFIQILSEKVGSCGSQVYLYELKNPWPRAFLTRQIFDVADNTSSFTQFVQAVAAMQVQPVALPMTTAPDTITISVATPITQYVFVGDEWLPGWHATIDGAPVTVIRADYTFMAITVPAGQHTVVLHYTP